MVSSHCNASFYHLRTTCHSSASLQHHSHLTSWHSSNYNKSFCHLASCHSPTSLPLLHLFITPLPLLKSPHHLTCQFSPPHHYMLLQCLTTRALPYHCTSHYLSLLPLPVNIAVSQRLFLKATKMISQVPRSVSLLKM